MERKENDVIISQDTKIAQQILGQLLGQKSGNGITVNINTIGQISFGMDKNDQRTVKFVQPNKEPKREMFGHPSSGDKLLTDGRIKNPQNRIEKNELTKVLNNNGWKRPETARELKITLGALYAKIRRFSINPPSGSWP